MIRFVACTIIALYLGTAGAARAAEQAPAAAELTALLAHFLDGASRNDIAVHERFWAEDLIYTRSAGQRVGKAEILASVRAGPESPEEPPVTYSAEDVRIQQYGDTAIVAFRLVGRTEERGPRVDRELPEHRHLRAAQRRMARRRLAGDARA